MVKRVKPWKTVSSVTKFEDSRLSISEAIVLLPNGKESTYLLESLTNIYSVSIIAVNDKGEIAIQREYSYPPNLIMPVNSQ